MFAFFGMPGHIELLFLALFVVVPVVTVLLVLRLKIRGNNGAYPGNPNVAPCPDCGHQVSIHAVTCPHCGRQLR